MIGLLERLISLADGSVWNIDDFKHSIENASSASWETANFIRDAIAGINEIESELKNIAPQIQTGEQRLKKAA
jgi:prophage DNA circulation protein